ncbi:MAG: condensation domain-containing protein, partial [Pyrinomonadaceae bacterium]
PVQIVHSPWKVNLPVIKLEDVPEIERQSEVDRIIAEECDHTFDITQLPLIRWTVLQLSEREHLFVQVEHHFVHDGWSLALLLSEIEAIYKAYSTGRPSPLPELPVQYADFAVWQQELMQGESLEDRLAYWTKKLADIPPLLDLPADRPRPSVQSYKGAVHAVELDTPLSRSLIEFSHREGVTLFMTMLTAFEALLYRYTWREDMVVGTSVANRPLREVEYLIGMIVNTLVLRTDMSGDPSYRELLNRVRDLMFEVYRHQDLPFEKLVERLQPQRVMNYNPLYQVMFNFHDAEIPDLEFPGLKGTLEYKSNRSAKFDLDVLIIPRFAQSAGRKTESGNEVLSMEWEYNTDLFDAATIERMTRHYIASLKSLVANPEQRLSELSLLSQAEEHQILNEWNNTQRSCPQDMCIHHLFEEQVRESPDAIAIEQ